ncbi:MAG: hypothetical protein IJF28_05565 [Firmicutes bacterium]|nr:hypothetical protein [Bacillota bacterium]
MKQVVLVVVAFIVSFVVSMLLMVLKGESIIVREAFSSATIYCLAFVTVNFFVNRKKKK